MRTLFQTSLLVAGLTMVLSNALFAQSGPHLSYNIVCPRTIAYSQSGYYIPQTVVFELHFANTGDEAARNVCAQVVLEDSTLLKTKSYSQQPFQCLDSVPGGLSQIGRLFWYFDVVPTVPLMDSTFVRAVITSFNPETDSEPDTLGIQRIRINFYPSPPPEVNIFAQLPRTLAFSAGDNAYQPETFTGTIDIWNFGQIGMQDVTVHLLSSDPQHLVPAIQGDSLTRRIASIPPGAHATIQMPVRYSETQARSGTIRYWVDLEARNANTGAEFAATSGSRSITLYDFLLPVLETKKLSIGPIKIGNCSGYESESVPATISLTNDSLRKTHITSLRLWLPPDWHFAEGDTDIVTVDEYINPYETFEYTWQVVPPLAPMTKKHDFTASFFFEKGYETSTYVTATTPAFRPHLAFATALPEIHIRFDTTTGNYTDDSFAIDASLAAWGGDFEPVTVEAELIYGSWMFLELDESQPGMERVQHVPELNMCDSVELHWQAKLIKPNEYGTPYEGAIKYTVYNADSSLFKEYTQPIIIDAVNQTSAAQLPAAQEMQLSAYPNPARGSTTISYTLPAVDVVSLRVYDMMGRRVATLFEGTAQPGTHRATFSGAGLPPGMYMATLSSDKLTKTVHILRF